MISDACGLGAITDSYLSSFSTVSVFLSLGSGALSNLSLSILTEEKVEFGTLLPTSVSVGFVFGDINTREGI